MATYTPLAAGYGSFALSTPDAALSHSYVLITHVSLGDIGAFSLTGGASNASGCVTVADGWRGSDAVSAGVVTLISEGFLTGDTAFFGAMTYGPAVSEAFVAGDTTELSALFAKLVSEGVSLDQVLLLALDAAVAEGLGFSNALAVIEAVVLLQTLTIGDTAQSQATFRMAMAEALLTREAFGSFFGVDVAELAAFTAAVAPLWQFVAAAAEHISLADALGGSLLVNITATDALELADDEVLQYILSGQIDEGIQITAGYVTPSGVFTTWAINTRTTGVTEYHDFVFDSMVQFGRKALAADATGLYELNGDTDAGDPIVADILSGFAQFGGSHFSAIKAAYLGVASSGQFILKLITGDGLTYIYEVTARNMRTTRVNLGKGLRSRYFRFELINADGDDFDLDAVEFLPLVSQRRV